MLREAVPPIQMGPFLCLENCPFNGKAEPCDQLPEIQILQAWYQAQKSLRPGHTKKGRTNVPLMTISVIVFCFGGDATLNLGPKVRCQIPWPSSSRKPPALMSIYVRNWAVDSTFASVDVNSFRACGDLHCPLQIGTHKN